MKSGLKRHYLLEISAAARERLFRENDSSGLDVKRRDELRCLLLEGYGTVHVPGIARRDEDGRAGNFVPAGFSSLNRIDGGRLRIPAYLKVEEIESVHTPYSVIEKEFVVRNRCLNAVAAVTEVAEEFSITAGIWGSAGLELHTGLPYTDSSSDVDLLVRPAPFEVLKEFYEDVCQLSGILRVNLDAEIDFEDGSGIKLAELFAETNTLLAKNINGVCLKKRSDVMYMLHQNGQSAVY